MPDQSPQAAEPSIDSIIGRPDKPFHKAECQCDHCKVWIAANPPPANLQTLMPSQPTITGWGRTSKHVVVSWSEWGQRPWTIMQASSGKLKCFEEPKSIDEIRAEHALAPPAELSELDPDCVCGHPLSLHFPPADMGKCRVIGCACGPGCIHDGYVAVDDGVRKPAPPAAGELPTGPGVWGREDENWLIVTRYRERGMPLRFAGFTDPKCMNGATFLELGYVEDLPRGGWRQLTASHPDPGLPTREKSVTPPTETVGGHPCSEKCSSAVREASTETRSGESSTTPRTDLKSLNVATSSGCDPISSGQPTPSADAADSAARPGASKQINESPDPGCFAGGDAGICLHAEAAREQLSALRDELRADSEKSVASSGEGPSPSTTESFHRGRSAALYWVLGKLAEILKGTP